MRKHWQLDVRAWSEDMPLGGGEPGVADGLGRPADRKPPGPDRVREVEGGASIGGKADPGRIKGDVSYVNDPPEPIERTLGGGGGPVSLVEGGDTAVGPVSEGGADTGGPGGEQAGGASNTRGIEGDRPT